VVTDENTTGPIDTKRVLQEQFTEIRERPERGKDVIVMP